MCKNEKRKLDALKASNHVAYEIKMFLYCITKLPKTEKGANLHKVLIESFVMHFRNLYSYFLHRYDRTKKECDSNVYYSDIKNIPFPIKQKPKKDYDHACKKMMHIDKKREELKSCPWDYVKLYSYFITPIKSFIEDPDILSYIKNKGVIEEINEYIKIIELYSKNPHSKYVTDTTS